MSSIANTLNKISKEIVSMSDIIKNEIKPEGDISEISVKDSSFITTEEDYFIQSWSCNPNGFTNGFTNKNVANLFESTPIFGLLELIQSRSEGKLRGFIDGEGWLRYAESGTYIFNRTGDRIALIPK